MDQGLIHCPTSVPSIQKTNLLLYSFVTLELRQWWISNTHTVIAKYMAHSLHIGVYWPFTNLPFGICTIHFDLKVFCISNKKTDLNRVSLFGSGRSWSNSPNAFGPYISGHEFLSGRLLPQKWLKPSYLVVEPNQPRLKQIRFIFPNFRGQKFQQKIWHHIAIGYWNILSTDRCLRITSS